MTNSFDIVAVLYVSLCYRPYTITGNALALHCCKAHAQVNRKI